MDQQPQSPSVPSDGSALNSSEKGTKKSGKVLPIILILVALAGVGFGVYGLFFKPSPACSCPDCIAENAKKTEEQPPQETPDPTEQKAEGSFLDTSRFKTQLSIHKEYRVSFTSTGLHGYGFEKNDKSEWTAYPLGNFQEQQVLNLSGEPAQIFIGAFGVDDGGATAFFVLQDGTVEYFKLYDEKGEENTEFTIQKYEGLNNIVRLQQAYGYIPDTPGGGYTVIAEDKDGYYYDLSQL